MRSMSVWPFLPWPFRYCIFADCNIVPMSLSATLSAVLPSVGTDRLFRVGLEFAGFIVVIGTHFVVVNDFAFDLFGLVIPKIGIDGEPGRCDHIYLSAIPQTCVNGRLRFCIIAFYALFDDESYFHSTQIPD